MCFCFYIFFFFLKKVQRYWLRKEFGSQWKFPSCYYCDNRHSKSNPGVICLNCLNPVCIRNCSQIVSLEWDRWCNECIKKEKRVVVYGNSAEVFKQEIVEVENLGVSYPLNFPWVIHIRDCIDTDIFNPVRLVLKQWFEKFKCNNKKEWDVDKILELGKAHSEFKSSFLNASKKKWTLLFNGSLKYERMQKFWENEEVNAIYEQIPYDHKPTTLNEEIFKQLTQIDLVPAIENALKVIRNKTNIPVGDINYKYAHELVGNYAQGISAHKDFGTGEKHVGKRIGYLPIVILINWYICGYKYYTLLKDSFKLPVFQNSVIILVGPAAEQIYHGAKIETLNGIKMIWYLLSQLRIPDCTKLK